VIDLAAARVTQGYAMQHMANPVHDLAVTVRRVYHYPFWAIERTTSRWDWRVAQTAFRPEDVPDKPAHGVYRRWQSRLFGDAPSKAVC